MGKQIGKQIVSFLLFLLAAVSIVAAFFWVKKERGREASKQDTSRMSFGVFFWIFVIFIILYLGVWFYTK
jgi:hypothetical protein